MKIALVLYCRYRFGGAERRLLRVFDQLGRYYETALIVKSCSSDKLKEDLKLAGCDIGEFAHVKTIDFKSSIKENFCVLLELMRLQPDVTLVVDSCGLNYILAKCLHLFKKRLVVSIANGLYYYDAIEGREDAGLQKLLGTADHIDLLYPGHIEYYRKHVRSSDAISITPGTFTDLSLFQPDEKGREFVFLAARLESQKNPQMMVEAIKICADSLREHAYRVVICGQGWEEENIRQQIKSFRLEDIVTMPGYVHSHDVLPHAAVLCAIQLKNNYPSQTIAEAAACGCFVIATNVGETARIIDEAYSVGIEPTANALAESMVKYMELSETAKKAYVDNARAYAQAHFSITQSVEYFYKLFKRVYEK